MATAEQLAQFQNLVQGGDFAKAASLAQGQGFGAQDVTNYINTNPALFGFPSNVPLSAVQPFFTSGTTPTTATTPTTPTTPATTTPATTTPTTTPTTTVPATGGTPTTPGGSFTQGAALPSITTTQKQETSAPSWYMDYLSGLAQKSAQAAQGAQYVGASPLQQKAFDITGQAAGQYSPMLQKGAGFAETAGGAKAYENVGQYMNPYVEDVVKRIGELGQRQIEQNIAPGVTSGLVGAGQFGSKRGAEALGQTLRDVQQNILGQQSQALQSGYTQALAAAQGDLARQLTAGQQLGALAQAGQGMNLADINALATLGAQQQAIQQNKELFPLQQLANQAAVLRGYAVPTSVAQTYTGPIPGAYAASPLQQIVGIATLLGGLSNTKFGSTAGNAISKALSSIFGGGSSGGGGNLTDQDWLNWATSGSSGTPGAPFSLEDLANMPFRNGGSVKKYRHGGDVRGYATAGLVSPPPIPGGLSVDSKAREDYFAELNKLLEAIQERSESGPNLFEVAGALLDPGRTGSAGEALGRASTVMGQKLERERERELPLAQARASIAGQKFQIENEARALDLVAKTLGTTPEVIGTQISDGTVPTDMLSRMSPGLFLTVNKLDPKLGSALKSMFDMDVERKKLAAEDVKAGMNYAEGIAKYGSDFAKLLPRGLKIPGMPEPVTAGATSSPQPPRPAVPTSTAPAKAPAEATSDLEGMPLAARADVLRDRAKAREEESKPMRADIMQWTPQAISLANNRLDELIDISNDPEGAKVFGLMQKQGILPAMAAAAQEAVRVGQTSVTFPVQQFLEKLNLTPTQQRILRRASQLLTEEFFESAKLTRSVLGPQMSNADTIIQQRPMATIEDAASTVDYWAKQRKLLNYQRRDMFGALNQWDRRVGVQAPASQFFTSREYQDIVNKYDDLQKQFRQKYPGFGAR